MTNCLICQSPAREIGSRDHGDKVAIDCPRCGRYEISRTAVAMLPSRIQGTHHYARLSHSVRTAMRKPDELFMITSANLDELVAQPLPDPKTQLNNFLKWLSGRLGEDRLGSIKLPPLKNLAGIIGTIDVEPIERLIQHCEVEGLIELNAPRHLNESKQVGLTLKGWEYISQGDQDSHLQTPDNERDSSSLSPTQEDEIVSANCNRCGGQRKAFVRSKFTTHGSDEYTSWSETVKALECRGCGDLSMEHEFWFSEWDSIGLDPITGEPRMEYGVKKTTWPPPSVRKKPEWSDRLDDSVLRDVMDETYLALDHGMMIVAAIGARTMLDRAMYLKVGDQPRGFPGKLDAMVKSGRMGSEEKETFLAITDVGNAAAHRGHAPSRRTLDAVFAATEGVLHREFILPSEAEEARRNTPKKGEQ